MGIELWHSNAQQWTRFCKRLYKPDGQIGILCWNKRDRSNTKVEYFTGITKWKTKKKYIGIRQIANKWLTIPTAYLPIYFSNHPDHLFSAVVAFLASFFFLFLSTWMHYNMPVIVILFIQTKGLQTFRIFEQIHHNSWFRHKRETEREGRGKEAMYNSIKSIPKLIEWNIKFLVSGILSLCVC